MGTATAIASAVVRVPSEKEPHLVICTRLRDEAPYIREFVEYHLLIGFDTIFLMNDQSTDDSQCFLDAYANLKKDDGSPPAVRVMESMMQTGVFDECARIIRESPEFDQQNTWMLTSDLDEFLWFNTTEFTSLKQAIPQLSKDLSTESRGEAKSLHIPRLLFGSSGQTMFDSSTVMFRKFVKRYDPAACPSNNAVANARTNEQCTKFSFCNRVAFSQSPFDNSKLMSLVAALATECHNPNNTKEIRCVGPHVHALADPRMGNTSIVHSNQIKDPTSATDKDNLEGKLMLVHYMTKSRNEFLHRACSHGFFKYYMPKGCNPEKHFKSMDSDFSLYQDTLMLAFASSLEHRLAKTEPHFSHCKPEIPPYSPEDYHQCWEQTREVLLTQGRDV